MASNYLPSNCSQFITWLASFVAYATANRVALGLTLQQITDLTAALADLQAKQTAQVAALNASRAATEAVRLARGSTEHLVRGVVNLLQCNAAVTDPQREALDIPVRDRTRTPVPPPSEIFALLPRRTGHLQQEFQIVNTDDPTRRAKPAAVAQFLIYCQVGGTTPPASPAGMPMIAICSRDTFTAQFEPGDGGKTAWLTLVATNAKGDEGPAGEMVAVTVAA